MMNKMSQKNNFSDVESESLAEVCFEVKVPEGTEPENGMWISGNVDQLGQWEARGLPLEQKGENLWQGKIKIRQGSLLFFKVNQGSWETVEVDEKGYDIQDRSFMVRESSTVSIEVVQFAKGGARAHASTRDEHVVELGYFGEKTTGEARLVELHLPPNYSGAPRSYPLVYMLDGQNLFDAATAFMGQEWAADKTHDRLLEEGKIEPFITVAIHHINLRHEYFTPNRDKMLGEGGKLHLLEKTIKEEIEPAIFKDYRIRRGPKNTAIIGSSLGGLAALHLGWRHPDRYGLIGAISPSLWWSDYCTYDMIYRDRKPRKLKIWLDMGTRESQFMHRPLIGVSKLAYLLKKRNFDVQLYIDKDATHSEVSWRHRLDKVFTWLLGREGGRNWK